MKQKIVTFLRDLRGFLATPLARKLSMFCLFLLLVGSILILTISTPLPEHARQDKGDDGLVMHLFEIGGFVALLSSIYHASRRWPKREVAIFFLSCFAYALLFEDMNIQMSGDYSYNKDAWFVVHNTMLVIAFGWCAIAYCVVLTIRENPAFEGWNPVEKGILAGLLALSIDLGIDVTAFAYGLWYWKGGSFFGVPMANFVGWFAAVFWFVFALEYIRFKKPEWDFETELKVRLLAIFPQYGGLLIMVGISFTVIGLLEVLL